MLRFLLDTDTCIRVLRDRTPSVRERFAAEADALCTSTVVLFELFRGAARSDRPGYQRRKVTEFAARFPVLSFDAAAADHAADIRVTLERAGSTIGAYDLMIAGHARSQSLIAVTGNLGEFRRVDGLRCENWLDG